jgi:hypothetical protein
VSRQPDDEQPIGADVSEVEIAARIADLGIPASPTEFGQTADALGKYLHFVRVLDAAGFEAPFDAVVDLKDWIAPKVDRPPARITSSKPAPEAL